MIKKKSIASLQVACDKISLSEIKITLKVMNIINVVFYVVNVIRETSSPLSHGNEDNEKERMKREMLSVLNKNTKK